MDTPPREELTRQEALTFFQTHPLNWHITKQKARMLAKALGVDLHIDRPWANTLPLIYLITVLVLEHENEIDEEAQEILASGEFVPWQ